MLRIIQIIIVVVGGLGLGGAASWYSIQENHGFGALNAGAWIAWPLAGDTQADPYTKAKVAAEGEIPLGAAEGITFYARTDDAGRPLRADCRYRLRGSPPRSRYWTLTAVDLQGRPLQFDDTVVNRLTSNDVFRVAGQDLVIGVAPQLTAGNWLKTVGSAPFHLVLNLYDTPITGAQGIVDPQMPAIALLECPA
ncbi:MAG: DUF1214 domain-containing protein [Ahrensia sp.]|nr:DUF1214 domain-containing protein [Ahrensia sp.]